MSEDLSRDWNNLTGTIRNVSNDSYNSSLGLAKFMSEDQLNKKNIELKNIDIEKGRIDLRSKQAQDNLLQQPVMLSNFVKQIYGDQLQTVAPNGSNIEPAAQIAEMMKIAGITVQDENNPSSDQLLVLKKNGKPITNYDIKALTPYMASYIVSKKDPLTNMIENINGLKQELGGTGEGPLLSKEEQLTISQDPTKKDLLNKYSRYVTEYENYQRDPRPVTRIYHNMLTKAEGIFKSIGGDVSDIVARKKELQAKLEGVETTPEMSKATGISEGTVLPANQAVEVGKSVSTLQGNVNTNKAHLEGIRLQNAAHLAAANSTSRQNALSTEHNQVRDRLNPLLVAEAFDKSWQVGPNGLRQSIDPTTKEVVTLSQGEYETLRNKAVQTHIDNLKQEYQYNGTAKRLGITFPETFKAPLQTRREFGAVDKEVKGVLKNINDPNFTANINSMLQQATQALKNEDPKVWEEGRNLLLQAKTLTAKQVAAKKRNIPNDIKQVVKDNSTGLNAWGYDSPN